jgi:ASC-1-like (ASCH) protein
LNFFFQEAQTLGGQLPESAAALEKNYESVKKGKEHLEAKLNKAKSLKEKITKLKSGAEFLLPMDISQLGWEISIKTFELNTSSIAESEIRILEEEIDKIKSSRRIITPTTKVQMRNQIEAMQKSITNATKVQDEICNAEKDSGFCSDAKIDQLQKELDSVQRVFKKLQRLNSGRVNFCNFVVDLSG